METENKAALLNTILESSTEHSIIALDLDGVILAWNEGARRIYGYASEEVLGKKAASLLHVPEDNKAGRSRALLDEVLRTGKWEGILPRRRKDGGRFNAHVTKTLHRDASGKAAGFVAIERDLTPHEQQERELRQAQERFNLMTAAITEVFWITDPAVTRIIYISPAYERVWGRTCESLYEVPMSFLDAVVPEDKANVLKVIQQQVNGLPFDHEYRITQPDGTQRWIWDKGFPVRDDAGHLRFFAGVAQDITERKAGESRLAKTQEQFRQAQKLEAVGRLAGGIAHDFNNLLTAIMGYTQLLLPTFDAKDPRREDLEEVEKTAKRAAALTRQLLAFSRRQILEPKTLELNGLVSEVGKMLHRLIGEDIRLSLALNSQGGLVHADPGQLEQVLMNLAVNARDAMPKGGVITVETQDLEVTKEQANGVKAGAYVMLAVSDTGCGMDEQAKAHLFEPFFTTKGKDKGTGLGLSTVYGIIAQSGGHIRVYSEADKGTTFKILLPRVMACDNTLPEPAAAVHETPSGKETILLAEDEPTIRRLVSRVLRGLGYTILEASDGRMAVELAEKELGRIHLLLTDAVMPRLGGREAAKEILKTHPEARVLYMSGYTDEAIVDHGILEPGLNFISKPFNPNHLALKLRQVLDAEPAP